MSNALRDAGVGGSNPLASTIVQSTIGKELSVLNQSMTTFQNQKIQSRIKLNIVLN